MTSLCCIEFLRGLLEAFPQRQIRVICDSAPGHHSEAMHAFVRKHPRLRLQYQPTYAPWTNPVERVWQQMRRGVTHCHDLPDIRTVVATALNWCQSFAAAPATVRRLVSFQSPSAS